MSGGIDLQQESKEVDDAAGIFVAKAAGIAVRAAWVEWEDRLEMRRLQLRRHELFGAEAGYADHADIAVAPGLGRDPFDEVVAVERARAAGFRLADAARIADHVHVAAPDEETRVAGLGRTGPQHRPGRMGERRLRRFRTLQVLVVNRERQQGRELFGRFRTIDVDRDLD